MEIHAETDIGKVREMNQDYYYISEAEAEMKLYILADGMGGYIGGEIASKTAVESVRKYIYNNCDNTTHLLDLIKEAIEYANMMVYEKSREDKILNEMGTTLDVVLIVDRKAYIGHVGDSKIYNINGNKIKKITTDHSYVEKLVKDGTITREEAMYHPKKNMLMKAIGSNTFVVPDLLEKDIQYRDTILMCSDGLTNMIPENQILDIINKNATNSAKELIEQANHSGGMDNITVIVIKNII